MEEPKQIEEPTKKEEPMKFNILQWTTVIYAFLTFLAYSYIDTYYSYWGIEIYSYLDASEILLIFLSIFKSAMLFAASVMFYLIAITLVDTLNFKSKSNVNKNHWSQKPINPIISITLLIIGGLYILYLVITDFNYHYLAIILYLVAGFLFIYLNKKLNTIVQSYNKNINLTMAKIVVMSLLLLYIISVSSMYKYQKVIKQYNHTSFNFTYESVNYKSNDSLLFIGATSKYLFIRNTKDSTNLIFDKAGIKNLSLTEKRETKK